MSPCNESDPVVTGLGACLDCRRREATATDGLCDECADLSAQAEQAAAEAAQLSLSEEWAARELAADDERVDLLVGR